MAQSYAFKLFKRKQIVKLLTAYAARPAIIVAGGPRAIPFPSSVVSVFLPGR